MKLYLYFLLFLISFSQVFAQNSSQLFQQALLKENGEGDLKAAVAIYEKIVADDSAERETRANAQLHIGMCWEKMGKQQAISAYKLVLEQFNDQPSIVQEAKLRLTQLEQNDSGKKHIIQPKYKKITDVEDWCNFLDCSPNGKWLVLETFAEGNHQLWLVERRSGEKHWLMDLDGGKGDVRWSPLGNFISFSVAFAKATEGGIWLLPVDQVKGKINGELEFIPVGDTFYSYDWRFDEKKVCFSSKYEKNLGIIDINQKSTEILLKDELPKFNIRWSADGKNIYYFSPKGIFKVEIKSKKEVRIGEGALIDISPNGEFAAILNIKDPENTLRITSLANGKHFLLQLREDRHQQKRASFSSDSRKLIIPSWHEYYAIRSVDLNSGVVDIISDERGGFSQPVVSPLGDKMVYQEWKPTKNTLHIRNLKNNLEELIPLGALFSRPSWSPDGRFIAYRESKNLNLFDMKTTEISTLAEHEEIQWYRINWSKDSKKVAYVAEQEKQNTIFVTDVESNTQKIVSSENELTAADWMDEGEKLLYVQTGKGWSEVIVHSLDTGHTKTLCRTEMTLTSPVISPDERWFVVFGKEIGNRNGLFYACSIEEGNLKSIGPATLSSIEQDFVFWLPDSKHITALIYEDIGTTTHLHVLSIDGTEDRIVTQQDHDYKQEYSITTNGETAYYDAMTWMDGMVSEVDISEALEKLK